MPHRTCHCDPAAVSNPSGHHPYCPEYEPWLTANGRDHDRSMPMADRGRSVYIWEDLSKLPSVCRFEPMAQIPGGAVRKYVVSAPLAWELKPDPHFGVALVNTYGDARSASWVLGAAIHEIDGFRLRPE